MPRHRIHKLSAVWSGLPFPMPEPQRTRSMRILVQEAKAERVPPAMLVTHLPVSQERLMTAARVRVMQRILREVPGVSMRMLALAFRRDRHRIRDLVGREFLDSEDNH
jgi:hypothetical protein